jgi:hypothetical protein
MNTISIKKNDDPFKKYWWVILLGFAGIGAWVCIPLMDTPIGSGSVSTRGLKAANQSLDAQAGLAPGSAYDLSMDGAYGRKNAQGEPASSLYQAPPETGTGGGAAGAPLTAAASASFAADMKALSKKTDPSGWGGAKAQKGFTAAKGNFSALSGLGSSGGGTGASSGGTGMGAFGTKVAQTGFASTRGLGAGAESGGGGKPIMAAAKAAADMGKYAMMSKSADAARSAAGAGFDGSRGGSAIGDGQAQGLGGAYSGLDAAPANLKVNDPNANVNTQETIPAEYAAEQKDEGEEMRKAIMMMVASAVISGVVGGVCNSIFGAGAGAAAGSASNPIIMKLAGDQSTAHNIANTND